MPASTNFDFPVSLLDSIKTVCSVDGDALAHSHNATQPVSIRLNPFKFTNGFNDLKPVLWCDKSYYLPERISFIKDPLFHAGCYYVQEASSMFLETVLKQTVDLSKDISVLDLCAAPGGKSTLISSLLTENSLLISNEVIKTRVGALAENMSKWGRSNVLVTNNDPKHFSSLHEYFDVIVVDAPCSGSGLFRKQTDAIEHWSEENVIHCSQRQQRILEDIIPALKPGGTLIYSTCSYSAEENEQIGDYLLEKELEPIQLNPEKQWGIIETQSNNKAWGYRFFPHLVNGEGFFISVFRKRIGDGETEYHRSKKKLIDKPNKEELSIISNFVEEVQLPHILKQKEFFFLINSKIETDLRLLGEHLTIRKKGTLLGEIKGKDFIPHHELALSNYLNNDISAIEVDKETALKFLKKSDIKCPDESPRGFCVVKFDTHPIGWIKNLGNRTNNYLPKEWRILTEI
ncbi:MAG: RNA methyltransferase [Bacteroidota bacterium]|nr:RNA methyltransferase [Bacteroidota bacterium]